MVSITILPLAAHCLRYSTKKKVSKMSMPSVGWSRMTMSVSSWRWQATLSLLFSEVVRSATLVCFTWLNPRSSIRASI